MDAVTVPRKKVCRTKPDGSGNDTSNVYRLEVHECVVEKGIIWRFDRGFLFGMLACYFPIPCRGGERDHKGVRAVVLQ